MGYNSSVAFAAYKEDFMEMFAEARKKESEQGAITNLFLTIPDYIGIADEDRGDRAVVVITWGCIRWYYDFESVRFLESWMDEAEEQGIPFEFARCGEEPTDCDTRYCDDGFLGFGEYVRVIHEVGLARGGRPFDPEEEWTDQQDDDQYEQLEFDFEELYPAEAT